MMDGGLLNSMVGDYLHAVGSKCAQEFRELTKAAPLPPDSPGLGEMVQQISAGEMVQKISAMTEIFHQFHAMTPVKRKLEMHEEEVDNPSPDKKSKKGKSSRVAGNEEKTEPAVKAPALAAKKDKDDDAAPVRKQVVEDPLVVGSVLEVTNLRTADSVAILKNAFGKYGTIIDAYTCKSGKKVRIGFITFSSPEEAGAAVAGANVGGRNLHCRIARPPGYVDPAVEEGRSVFIAKVSVKSTYDDFKEAVEKFGKVTGFYNTCRNSAFITFSTSEEAQACVAALDNSEVAGRTIKMAIQITKN